MDVNRGDQFDYLVSMSSPARGLNLFAAEHLPDTDPRKKKNYVLGDMNSSLIRTKRGRTLVVQHDTTSPRPYTRINLLQGTKGTFRGYPDRIHVEGKTEGHGWDDAETWRAEWEHPLWSAQGEAAQGARHGGMDFMEDYRLVKCLRGGEPTDMDVYDAAAWSVVTELSEQSGQRAEPFDRLSGLHPRSMEGEGAVAPRNVTVSVTGNSGAVGRAPKASRIPIVKAVKPTGLSVGIGGATSW